MKKISKTQMAKNLGISRPTLYQRMKDGVDISTPELDIQTQKLCLKFSAIHSTISPHELELILETLADFKLLNKDGIDFKSSYWELFIKD
jgi:DNA-binding XRE family transcriptional regulator